MIESVHTDDESEGNGNDPDGSRDHTLEVPICCWSGFGRGHVLSLPLNRKRAQLQLVNRPVQVMTSGLWWIQRS